MPKQRVAGKPPRWVPGTAHSHTYFLVSGGMVVGKVAPIPRFTAGNPPWGSYVAQGVGWKRIGEEWGVSEARELVEAKCRE
jgi:hypothetical protein